MAAVERRPEARFRFRILGFFRARRGLAMVGERCLLFVGVLGGGRAKGGGGLYEVVEGVL